MQEKKYYIWGLNYFRTNCICRHKSAAFSEANEMIGRCTGLYSHERIQSKNRSGAAHAAPLFLAPNLPASGGMPVRFGAVHNTYCLKMGWLQPGPDARFWDMLLRNLQKGVSAGA